MVGALSQEALELTSSGRGNRQAINTIDPIVFAFGSRAGKGKQPPNRQFLSFVVAGIKVDAGLQSEGVIEEVGILFFAQPVDVDADLAQ